MKTSVVNCRTEPYDVYIGRPSDWGNPFSHISDRRTLARHRTSTRAQAIQAYREWITSGEGRHLLARLGELRGKRLGCWCKPRACHGDVLVELIEHQQSAGTLF